jgi:hypothetical protein
MDSAVAFFGPYSAPTTNDEWRRAMRALLIVLAMVAATSAQAKGCYDYSGDIVAVVGPYEICPPGSTSR